MVDTITTDVAPEQQSNQANQDQQSKPALHPLKSMTEVELEKAVQESWKRNYGENATAELLTLGERLSEYACRGSSKSKRFDRACDVIRLCSGGLFGTYEQKRIRFAIVAWQLCQRVSHLSKLPVSYLQTVVEATGIGVDWKLVTDNATPLQVDRLGKVLPLLVDRTLGVVEGKAGVTPKLKAWREIIKRAVNDGETIEELKAESEKPTPPVTPSTPANQPTANQAGEAVAQQQLEQTVGAPIQPINTPELSKAERLALVLAWIDSDVTADELQAAMVAHGKVELLTRLNDAANNAADLLLASKN